MNCTTTNLVPNHENVKSYYGKTKVIEANGRIILQSYETKVADLDSSNRLILGAGAWTYSQTTCRHVKEFCWYLNDSGRVPNLMQTMEEIQGKEKIKSFSALIRRVYWIDKDGKYELMN